MALQEGSEPSRIKFKPTSKALALTAMEPSEKKLKIDVEAEMCERLIPGNYSDSTGKIFFLMRLYFRSKKFSVCCDQFLLKSMTSKDIMWLVSKFSDHLKIGL